MSAETQPVDGPRHPRPGKLTCEDFLDWCDEDTLAEWVDGEVVMVSPASLRHQDLGNFHPALFRIVAEQEHLGRVIPAPFQMRLEMPPRGREPDIIFVARDNLGRLRPTYLDGPADLVVEITSPESFAREWGHKFVEYERAGVSEYRLIDPDRRHADFYRLGDDGRYRTIFMGERGENASPNLPRLRLRVEWFWSGPLPNILDVLRELSTV